MSQQTTTGSVGATRPAHDWSISALRLASMAAIVACHICQANGLAAAWWLNAGVQVFLVISGYLYGGRDFTGSPVRWFVRRFVKLWVPFAIVAVCLIVADVVSGLAEVSVRQAVLGIICVRPGGIPNGAHLWYVAVALLCYLITPCLHWLRGRFGLPSLLIPAAVLALVGNHVLTSGAWAAEYVVGFCLGSLARDGNERVIMKAGAGISGVVGVAMSLLVMFGIIDIGVDGIGYIALHYILGVLVFCAGRLVLGCSSFIPHDFFHAVLRFSDKYSYEIYLVHQVIILGSFSVFFIDAISVPIGILISVCWSVVCAAVLHTLSKLIEKPIAQALSNW